MNFIEFIAFIFTMFAMVWLMMRRVKEAGKAQPEDPDEGVDQEREQLREYMKMLNIQVEEIKPKVEAPPPPPQKQRQPKPQVVPGLTVDQKALVRLHENAYDLKFQASRVKKIVRALPTPKQIMIIHEILSRPKGF